jgi:hypothetical protein
MKFVVAKPLFLVRSDYRQLRIGGPAKTTPRIRAYSLLAWFTIAGLELGPVRFTAVIDWW